MNQVNHETSSKNQQESHSHVYSWALSAFGALGVALQNYQGVELALTRVLPVAARSKTLIELTALAAGGLCSGMVNFWMNQGLLDGFFARMTARTPYRYTQLTAWERVQYFGGIFVFSVTGILFGLTAFTFAMEGPIAILSIAVGIFVAAIMTIQEIETWLSSYDQTTIHEKEYMTISKQIGKYCGHMIAAGNVIALSLLFTLSLAQSLVMLHVAMLPALTLAAVVAFTFGAFTEYYFYNYYLAAFCKNFYEHWHAMLAAPNAAFGFLCVTTNAIVNMALTYAGLDLLATWLLVAEIALPPVVITTLIFGILSCFAGAASFALGMDFWNKQSTSAPASEPKAAQGFFSKSPYVEVAGASSGGQLNVAIISP